ncbi:LamG domain-containing protein, partial [Candidatus Woesearchaeota archaeon]|nr:LamG domain-containing protein [Candidatus Woesearchaeota archaeon]
MIKDTTEWKEKLEMIPEPPMYVRNIPKEIAVFLFRIVLFLLVAFARVSVSVLKNILRILKAGCASILYFAEEKVDSIKKSFEDQVAYLSRIAYAKKAEINKFVLISGLVLLVFFLFTGILQTKALGGPLGPGETCAYDSNCSGWCDNEPVLGLTNDTYICFQLVSCGGLDNCGNFSFPGGPENITCQVNGTSTNESCDDFTPWSCLSLTTVCGDSCLTESDRDISEEYCEASGFNCSVYGLLNWSIGGETAATECCGDDASENIRTQAASGTMDNGFASNSSQDACCLASTDCVSPDGTCVDTGDVSLDVDNDGDTDYCNSGTWYDCLTSEQCGGSTCYVTLNCDNHGPTQDTPYITPDPAFNHNDLICNYNNVIDTDGDDVVNITNWYENNISLTVLNVPFEGNGNEDNNATDYSGNNNNGTVFGATWNNTAGGCKLGKCYEFDGSSKSIEIPDDDSLDITNDYTIEAWVYRNTDSGTYERILSKSDSADYDLWMQIVNTDTFNCGVKKSDTTTYHRVSASTIPTGQWTHIACSLSSSNVWTLYINGQVSNGAVTGTAGPARASTRNLQIGRLGSTGWSYNYNGKIDELKIWNKTVSSDQIYQNYLAGSQNRSAQVLVDDETWTYSNYTCSVTVNDGFVESNSSYASDVMIHAPEISQPVIEPSPAGTMDNLYCSYDANASFNNITNWYENNISMTVLNMPFEGVYGNEANNATDYSDFSNNGTVMGGAAWNTTAGACKVGRCYTFDGSNDYINLGAPAELNIIGPMTVEAWIKPEDMSTYQGIYIKFGGTAAPNTYQYMFGINSGDNFAYYNPNNLWEDLGLAVSYGQWQHIAYVYDGSTIVAYKNGVNGTPAAITAPSSQPTYPVYIGSGWSAGFTNYFFKGKIDELRVWNRSLSGEQIYQDYIAGVQNRSPQVLAADETFTYKNYTCHVTPNDLYVGGTMRYAVEEFIEGPVIGTPAISPAPAAEEDNITCEVTGNYSANNITNWYVNNVSLMVLNMPFEGVYGNEDNNVTDYTDFGNNGTVFGATWNRTGGVVGGAYTFDGSDDYMEVDSVINDLQMSTTGAVSIWVKIPTDDGTENVIFSISRDADSTITEFCIDMDMREGADQINVAIREDGTYHWHYRSQPDSLDASVGEWANVVVTQDGIEPKIYLNGVFQTPVKSDTTDITKWFKAILSDATSKADTATIGLLERDSSDLVPFIGELDEVKIYNKSLSAEQIYLNYLAGSQGRSSDTISSDETAEGEEWICSVTPNDGNVNGETKNSSTTILLQGRPVVVDYGTSIEPPYYDTNVAALIIHLWELITDSNLLSVNFTLTAPSGAVIIDNVNATVNSENQWNTSTFTLDQYGRWNYTISALDEDDLTRNISDSIRFLQITLNSSPDPVDIDSQITVIGHINDSLWNDVVNNTICITIDNESIDTGYDCTYDWWNNTWEYRKRIDVENLAATAMNNTIVLVNFSTLELIDEGKVKGDCGDVRFIDSDGEELGYNLEVSTCNTN